MALSSTGTLIHRVQGGSQYNTGTTQATNGQTVEKLVDTGGSANDVAQTTLANKPTLLTSPNDFDGACVQFIPATSANRQHMDLAGTFDREAHTIIMVHRCMHHRGYQQSPISLGSTALHGGIDWYDADPRPQVHGSAFRTVNGQQPSCMKQVTVIRARAGGICNVWHNLTKSPDTGTIGTGTNTGGKLSSYVSAGVATREASQDVFEVRIYGSAMSDADIIDGIQELAGVHNIALNPCGYIVFDGDSIFASQNLNGNATWQNANEMFQNLTLQALRERGLQFDGWDTAVSGQTTTQVISNFPTHGPPRQTAGALNIYAFDAGTNDFPPSTAQEAYDKIVQLATMAKEAGFKVIPSTLLYKYGASAADNAARDEVNEMLRANWRSFADELMDFADYVTYPELENTDNNALRTIYFNSADNIHPTSAGQIVMSREAERAILAVYRQFAGLRVATATSSASGGGSSGSSGWSTIIAAGGYGVDHPVLVQPGVQINRVTSKIFRKPADAGNTLEFREMRPVGITSFTQEPGFVLFGRKYRPAGSEDPWTLITNQVDDPEILIARDNATDVQNDAGTMSYSRAALESRAYVGGFDEFVIGQQATAVATGGVDTNQCELHVRVYDSYPTA